MENKIVKINLNYGTDSKLESIIVVRENKIETRTNPNYFQQILANLFYEMRNSNSEYKNLSEEGLKNKLQEKGILKGYSGLYIKNMQVDNDGITILNSNDEEERIDKASTEDYDNIYDSIISIIEVRFSQEQNLKQAGGLPRGR